MAIGKVKKGLAAGMLAGLAAVAAAAALTAASPAPAPAEPAVPAVAKAAAEVRGALAEAEGKPAEPGGETPSGRAGQDAATVPAEPPAAPDDPVPEGQDDPGPGAAQAGAPEPEAPAGERQAGSPSPAGGAKERRWVADYETVWVPRIETVVDVPAHEEPVYETHDVLVCNACGYRSQNGNAMGSHLSQHAIQGVDEGYCSIVEQVQTGTRTVPAVCHEVDNGHYEKRESGGHWE